MSKRRRPQRPWRQRDFYLSKAPRTLCELYGLKWNPYRRRGSAIGAMYWVIYDPSTQRAISLLWNSSLDHWKLCVSLLVSQ